jgi:hypothetical protein
VEGLMRLRHCQPGEELMLLLLLNLKTSLRRSLKDLIVHAV